MHLLSRMIACVFIVISGAALAGQASTEDIVCGLDPHCKRPLSRDFRGITVTSVAGGGEPLSVSLYVNFAYNSSELTSDARITLDRLGYALIDDRLKTFSFMIEGHTDAKGGDAFNQKLSERRAEAVRQYIAAQFGVDPNRLTAQGFGRSRLLDEAHPEDSVNRRVQILNLTTTGGR